MQGSSVFRTWLGRRTNPTIPRRRGCTLAMCWYGNRITERSWGVVRKEMMKCRIDGRARMEKRTRKEAKLKLRTRRDRSLVSRVGHFAHGAAQRCAEKLSWCNRLSTLPFVMDWQIPRSSLCPANAWAKNRSKDTQKKNLQNHWGEVDAPLQCFGMEMDSLKEDEAWFEKRWWTVGLMEEHGWRNVHENKQNENKDETTPKSVWWVELVILHIVLVKDVQRTVVVQQIQYIALCDATTSSRVFRNCGRISPKCSTTVGGQCPFRDAEAFSHHFRIKLMDSPESLVKSQIACVVENVLCELRFGRKPPINVVSSPPRSILLNFFVTSFWKNSFPLFHYIPPSS